MHEYYMGPHLHPNLKDYGFKVPTDCLGYVGIYKSGSSETLCNLRNNLGKRSRWKHGMGSNLLQRMIQIHMFPVLNESDDAVVDPKSSLLRRQPAGPGPGPPPGEAAARHGVHVGPGARVALRVRLFRDRILSHAVADFTIGEPYFFYDFVLHSPKQRENYKPGMIVEQNKKSCYGCSFWQSEVNSTSRAKQFVLDFLMLGMRPDFLWRHIFPQVAQANVFFRSAGPLDFVCHLEEFERGWEFAGMMANRSLDTFNRGCRGHAYSGSGSGFEPREAMTRAIFTTEGGPAENCAADGEASGTCGGPQVDADRALATLREALAGRPGVEGAIGLLGDALAEHGASDVATSLGCALLLPDYVCFGYRNVADPAACVAAGFADSLAQWDEIQSEVRRVICPGVRSRVADWLRARDISYLGSVPSRTTVPACPPYTCQLTCPFVSPAAGRLVDVSAGVIDLTSLTRFIATVGLCSAKGFAPTPTPVNDRPVVCAMSDAGVYFELLGIDRGRATATLVPAAVPVLTAAQRVTVETTAFTSMEIPVIIGVAGTEMGEVGIFTTPSGNTVLGRDMQAYPVEEHRVTDSARDARHHKTTTMTTKELCQSPFLDWPVPMPQTVKWCRERLVSRQGGPLEHPRSLVMTFGPRTNMSGFKVHRTIMRCLDEGFRGLVDVSDSAAVELLLSGAGLAEYVYQFTTWTFWLPAGPRPRARARPLPVLQHAVFDESAIPSEMTKDSGLAMLRPSFVAHVAPEVEHYAAILELVSRAREERTVLATQSRRNDQEQA
ncbi:unnamed protein product [Prorocentrum cordatum]|uniref:RNA-directed RNA polymerase n=1 Tax=Prorocentrum cordatum TaxID=2364126 RepID=A0ABN9RK49_9DINO|nr:unnamed protein product [Polarella glacialis]